MKLFDKQGISKEGGWTRLRILSIVGIWFSGAEPSTNFRVS